LPHGKKKEGKMPLIENFQFGCWLAGPITYDSLSSVIFFSSSAAIVRFLLDTLLLKVLPLPMYNVIIEHTVASRPPIIKYHVPYG